MSYLCNASHENLTDSVATHIGCMTHDQKVLGSNPVWVVLVWIYTSGV